MDSKIVTPCISVCKSDPSTDFCYGCGRTSEDKKMWKDPDTSDEWKKSNLTVTMLFYRIFTNFKRQILV